MTWQERYIARFYSADRGWVDGTTEFHTLCKATIPQGGRILEIGAGPSNATSHYLATLGELHGLDPDPDAIRNESLTSSSLLTSDIFPFEDESFDACVSNYVLEHVADPQAHLREVKRVLSPGGAYIVRTPNRFHYVALAAAATPHWFHKLLANRLRGLGAEAHDPYPTYYALNTRGSVPAAECRNWAPRRDPPPCRERAIVRHVVARALPSVDGLRALSEHD